MAVDVFNESGSVIVEVDDRIDAPVIEAGLLHPKGRDGDVLPDADEPGIVTASYEPARDMGVPANASTLRVRTTLGEAYPAGTKIALRVRVPRCDGLNIVNNGGAVVVVGTQGAVTVQNGATTGVGGRIEYRTSHPHRDPVALISTDGRITAVIAPEGAAQIELDTEDGQAFFGSAYGLLTDVRPGLRSYRGTWNGGQVPFVARTGRGEIQIFVKPDAEEYSTADDWMAWLFD